VRAAAIALALFAPLPDAAQEPLRDTPPAGADAPVESAPEVSAAEGRAALERALSFLVAGQREDGSWGQRFPDHVGDFGYGWDSYYGWQFAAHALACEALLRAPETPERRAALARALEWLCASELPVRGADWDVDSTWAALTGFVTCVAGAADPRLADTPWPERLRRRGLELYADLEARQTLDGGWAYYDDPPFTARPKWATSFCTALVLPPLRRARQELGWPIRDEVIERAVEAVRRCALPGGSFAYDYNVIPPSWTDASYHNVKGALGRIQVCNWALRDAGVGWVTDERVREGLAAFFCEHRWLDVARMKPIPHESWYQNSGYFYFFAHHYASHAIALLPAAERGTWRRKLRAQVIKTQAADGSFSDYLSANYLVTASTSYAIMTLAAGLEHEGAAGAADATGAGGGER